MFFCFRILCVLQIPDVHKNVTFPLDDWDEDICKKLPIGFVDRTLCHTIPPIPVESERTFLVVRVRLATTFQFYW